MSQDQKKVEQVIIAGDAAILARRYASALIELADEHKETDAVASDLRALRAIIHESAELRMLMTQPRLTRAQLVKAMQALAASAKFGKLTGNFLALAARNRRLSVLEGIIDAYLNELAARRGEFTADVRTARALTPAEQEQLATRLHAMAGGKVHLAIREDKSLIGGVTVKMGSRLIDASVRTRLDRLERQLKSAPQQGAA